MSERELPFALSSDNIRPDLRMQTVGAALFASPGPISLSRGIRASSQSACDRSAIDEAVTSRESQAIEGIVCRTASLPQRSLRAIFRQARRRHCVCRRNFRCSRGGSRSAAGHRVLRLRSPRHCSARAVGAGSVFVARAGDRRESHATLGRDASPRREQHRGIFLPALAQRRRCEAPASCGAAECWVFAAVDLGSPVCLTTYRLTSKATLSFARFVLVRTASIEYA